jgi:general secretion pathway protein K
MKSDARCRQQERCSRESIDVKPRISLWRPDERGLALILVLWGLALLSLMAVGVLSLERSARRSSLDFDQRARAEALSAAGINRAILSLLEPDPARRWRIDGTPRDLQLENYHFRVRIQDESGKIDLNVADRELLVGLFVSQGLSAQAADELTDKVLDWRDPTDAHRLNGSKDDEYRAAGYPYGPRNGPFQTVDELKLVMDVTPEMYKRIEPAITIYSQRPMINPTTAPREALLALPSFDAEKVETVLVARSGGEDASSAEDTGQNASVLDQPRSLFGLAFAIRVRILDREFLGYSTEAVIRITGDPREPYWVMSWRDLVD